MWLPLPRQRGAAAPWKPAPSPSPATALRSRAKMEPGSNGGGAFVASAGNRSQEGISGRIKARAAWHPASRSRRWEMPDEDHRNRSEQPWPWTGAALQLMDTSADFSSLLLYRSVSAACRGLHRTARRFLTPLWHCYTAASRKTAPGS